MSKAAVVMMALVAPGLVERAAGLPKVRVSVVSEVRPVRTVMPTLVFLVVYARLYLSWNGHEQPHIQSCGGKDM